MIEIDFLRYALSRFCSPTQVEGRLVVQTHCLYPSNDLVSVYVSGGPTGAVVSDGGGAVEGLRDHNRPVPNPDRYLRRFCKGFGLTTRDGKIFSPRVEPNQLSAAVTLVANASASAANWGLDHLKVMAQRDLRTELYQYLVAHFPKERVTKERKLSGQSNREYRFDNVVDLDKDKILVVDAVLPDSNSINSHAIAHMDLAQRHDDDIFQRIVYDNSQPWKAEDLNLLQMAARLVPISDFSRSINKLTVH